MKTIFKIIPLVILLLSCPTIKAQTAAEKAFLEAIRVGNLEKIDMYFELGFSPNSTRKIDVTDDMAYIFGNKIQEAECNKFPIFFDVIKIGSLDVIRYFIEKGANVNMSIKVPTGFRWESIPGSFGSMEVPTGYSLKYPLHLALKKHNDELIELLLNKGANPTLAQDEILTNWTNLKSIQYFEKFGAIFNFDTNALTEAVRNPKRDNEYINYLLSKGVKGDENTFMAAVRTGNIELCKLLLQNGCNVNEGISGYYPICVAISNNDLNLLKFLVSNGASLDTKCTYQAGTTLPTQSLIDYATNNFNLHNAKSEIVDFLILAPVYQKKSQESAK